MFILRFIGRILSIGFILFIVFVISGKGAKANSALVIEFEIDARGAANPAQIQRDTAPLARRWR